MKTPASNKLATESYIKLLLVNTGLFKIAEASSTTVFVKYDRIWNNVSVGQATVAQAARQRPSRVGVTQCDNSNAECDHPHMKGSNELRESVVNAPREYLVHRILRHVDEGIGVR